MSWRRRQLLMLAAAATASGLGCKRSASRRRPGPATAPPPTDPKLWKELSFGSTAHYPHQEHAVVMVKSGGPLLVALHGRGEAHRGLVTGARGWRDDYDLERAQRRLGAPPLEAKDLLGFVRPERLAQLNDSLRANPFDGLCVACPFTPDLPERSLAGSRGFASFVLRDLLPRVRREVGCGAERTRTSIDGVSMGGRLALFVGLNHPDVFGAVGALQPAIAPNEVQSITELASRAQAKAPQQLRLVTSDEDYFRPAVERLSEALRAQKVEHQLLVTPGPHDYSYNRGPGSFEMLLWHERVLRGLPPP